MFWRGKLILILIVAAWGLTSVFAGVYWGLVVVAAYYIGYWGAHEEARERKMLTEKMARALEGEGS